MTEEIKSVSVDHSIFEIIEEQLREKNLLSGWLEEMFANNQVTLPILDASGDLIVLNDSEGLSGYKPGTKIIAHYDGNIVKKSDNKCYMVYRILGQEQETEVSCP